MILLQLWPEFLSKTMPVLNGSLLFVYLQMGVGAVLPILTLFRMVKRENTAETVLLCIVPTVLIATVAIVEPLFFGSFLGDGFTKTEALRDFLYRREFFREAIFLCDILIVAVTMYLLVERKQNQFSIARTMAYTGFEFFVVLAVILLRMDYEWNAGYLWLTLPASALKWFIYGLYLLANKSCFYLLCLLWYFLFHERRKAVAIADARGYRAWLRHYYTKSYRVMAVALLLFACLFTGAVIVPLWQENGLQPFVIGMTLWGLAMAALGLYRLLCACFPMMVANYRAIFTWGDKDIIIRQLYKEVMEQPPLLQNELVLVTRNFLILRALGCCRIFYRPLLQSYTYNAGQYRLYFADGSICSLRNCDQRLAQLLGRQVENYKN